MADIHSYNSRASLTLKQLLLPTPAQLFLNLVIAIIILSLLNIRAIWQFFTTGVSADSTVDLGSLISNNFPWLTEGIEKLTRGRTIQVLFWLFVGCIVYMLIWIVGNFLTNIRNDIVADEYVHPQQYSRAGYWSSVLARKIFFVCIFIVLISYIFAGLRLVASLADLALRSFRDFQIPLSILLVLGAILAAAIALQILQILFKITLNSWQLIYKDL